MAESQDAKPCRRCNTTVAPLRLRNDPSCGNCYTEFVQAKIGKRIAGMSKETRTSRIPKPRRYLAGLSFGPSSTVMTDALHNAANYHASKKSSTAFEPLAVHVDTDLSHPADASDTPALKLLAKYRERYPSISFECVHLSKAVALKTVDWSSLPVRIPDGDDDVERLRQFFDALPSVTSRADVLRLLIRHLLVDMALERSYPVLLMGQTTTALAALTLSEVANGRGFAVPWQVNDGVCTVCTYTQTPTSQNENSSKEISRTEISVYYPVREIFKNEIRKFLELNPAVGELTVPDKTTTNAVISHKDQSIEEVMTRYFDSVEGPYSGIVANVVRTSGKLDRVSGGEFCHLCGMTLDEQGDSRWAGELGEDRGDFVESADHAGKLCYGCKRSIGG